jgi:hypothetical protein
MSQPGEPYATATLSSIPVYVYVVSGLLVGVLLGTQALGVWLTGFRRPVMVRGSKLEEY